MTNPNFALRDVTTGPDISTAFANVRLHVVTGKGGTGKTTVAAGLALALAQAGKRVLLCEVEGRQGISRLFDVPASAYTEQKLTTSRAGGQLFSLAVEPRAALMDYLNTFYVLGSSAGRILDGLGAVDFATTIAPGLRDVLLTGKVYEAVGRRAKSRGLGARGGDGTQAGVVFDAVVLDAPPTGRITKFLNVASEVSDLAKVGPIHKQAESMRRMYHSATTRVHMVTLLEDMPVQEACDGLAELADAGLPLGSMIVNRVHAEHFSPAQLDELAVGNVRPDDIEADLTKAGLGNGQLQVAAAGLLAAGRHHAERVRTQAEHWDRVVQMGRPIMQVPQLPTGVDRGSIHDIADSFINQGVRA